MLTPREWAEMAGMAAFIITLHVVGWGTLFFIVAPQHFDVGDKVLGMGVGLTAYALGLRHAFDADHIAAIDNTTRKLMEEGRRPLSVGFFFSLGHSSMVFGLALLIALGIKTIIGPVREPESALHHYTALIGTGVSGLFLYLIAAINIVILVGILKVFSAMRRGVFDAAQLDDHLNNRGLLNRLFRRFTGAISRPWQMYPLGMLFGLGFDTASFMNFAYGWAFSNPVRKVYYNITITGLSVAVALVIGTVELLGLVADQWGFSGGFWDWIAGLDLNVVGFAIVGLFALTWIAALVIWRVGRIEEKWATR